MLKELEKINQDSHIDTFHINNLNWENCKTVEEKEFCSLMCYDDTNHSEIVMAYIAKELLQLSEIERHVSAVLTIIISDLQKDNNPINDGYILSSALHVFAQEELNHANTFLRYISEVLEQDIKIGETKITERIALYNTDESPYVKLLALHTTAYIGESLITMFENKFTSIDKEHKFFITQMLVAHGLDEQRHIELDHFIFKYIQPMLSEEERIRSREIAQKTEEFNLELSNNIDVLINELLGDYKEQNNVYDQQISFTKRLHELIYSELTVKELDSILTEDDILAVESFTAQRKVHT